MQIKPCIFPFSHNKYHGWLRERQKLLLNEKIEFNTLHNFFLMNPVTQMNCKLTLCFIITVTSTIFVYNIKESIFRNISTFANTSYQWFLCLGNFSKDQKNKFSIFLYSHTFGVNQPQRVRKSFERFLPNLIKHRKLNFVAFQSVVHQL